MLTVCILRAPHVEQSIVKYLRYLSNQRTDKFKKTNLTLSEVMDFLTMMTTDPLLQNLLHH